MMQGDLYSNSAVTKLVNMLRNFLAVDSIWQSKNQAMAQRLLIQQALFHDHETLLQRLTVAYNKAAQALQEVQHSALRADRNHKTTIYSLRPGEERAQALRTHLGGGEGVLA